jgi:hypothetical protein
MEKMLVKSKELQHQRSQGTMTAITQYTSSIGGIVTMSGQKYNAKVERRKWATQEQKSRRALSNSSESYKLISCLRPSIVEVCCLK